MVPTFLQHIADAVLNSGKSTGLLRALEAQRDDDIKWEWRLFADLVASVPSSLGTSASTSTLFSVSIDTLSALVYDELLEQCQATGQALTRVLVDNCDLWQNLYALEEIYLMRRGDAMTDFTDILFAKVRISCSFHTTYNRGDIDG